MLPRSSPPSQRPSRRLVGQAPGLRVCSMSMEPLVRVHARSIAGRCAYCHDALGTAWAVCPGCATRLHCECREQALSCPTLGCATNAVRLRGASPRRRPSFQRALERLAQRDSLVSSIVALDDAPEPLGPATTLALFAHALASPLALAAFVAFFLLIFVPAHWAASLLGAGELLDHVRDVAQGPARRFSFEAVAAPFAAFALGAG